MSSKAQTHKKDKKRSKRHTSKAATRDFDTLTQKQTGAADVVRRAKLNPRSLTGGDAVQLQRTVGNQATTRLMTKTLRKQPAQEERDGLALAAPKVRVEPDQADNVSRILQRSLYIGTKNKPHPVETEELFEILIQQAKNQENKPVSEAVLLDANNNPDNHYLVTYKGSMFGHHGWEITGIEEILPKPQVPGLGNLTLEFDSSGGIKIKGRPGWTEEVVKAYPTVPKVENIRHIVPYHLIKDGFQKFINEYMYEGKAEELTNELITLASELGIDPWEGEGDDLMGKLSYYITSILAVLNSNPANLWPGGAEENQRINTLRTMMKSLAAKVEAGEYDWEDVTAHLKARFEAAKTEAYRELLGGLLDNHLLPFEGDAEELIERLLDLADSYEVDPNFEGSGDYAKRHDQLLSLWGFFNSDFLTAAVEFMKIE